MVLEVHCQSQRKLMISKQTEPRWHGSTEWTDTIGEPGLRRMALPIMVDAGSVYRARMQGSEFGVRRLS